MELLTLFAETEIFIFVFMEVVTKINFAQSVLLKKARWYDIVIFILVFGGFSIFGTLVGRPLPSGAIVNIRDFAAIVSGLAAGPLVGLGVGLIGGVHRYFLGGFTCIPCGLSTVFAGLICGGIYYLNKGKLIGIIPGMLVAVLMEAIHGGLTLLIARPFAEAVEVVKIAIPPMMIANSMGVAIGIIIMNHEIEIESKETTHS
ncbi:MAG: hypothetical protein FJ008_03620 [Chloroflexi bacterium]|nr:hypothetical protein [Chloroflexota bacterium]MBM3173134.1 hypothetical protein [Chloroflexota bacterium]MBM3175578.1 hypothetical protein [Chloroflexota bacterium]MBM4451365.1 hypothetical protein [Chloroflexota bacterium]